MSRIEQRHVAVSMLRSLLYFLERQGLDAPALARDAGLPHATLADRERRVSSTYYAALMQAGIERTGNPLLGLEFGMAVEPDRWGLLGVLVTHCADVGEAIRFQLRFQSLVSTVGEAALVIAGRRARPALGHAGNDGARVDRRSAGGLCHVRPLGHRADARPRRRAYTFATHRRQSPRDTKRSSAARYASASRTTNC